MSDRLKDANTLHTTIVLAEHCIATLECIERETTDARTRAMASKIVARIKNNQSRLVDAYDKACFAVRNGREFS